MRVMASLHAIHFMLAAVREFSRVQPISEAVPAAQPAYQDADSTSTAMQAAAPIGVTEFRTEKLVLAA